MTRRLILAALALFAFLSLESCGVNRLAGPVAVEPTHTSRQSNGGRKFDGNRDGDNGDIGGGGGSAGKPEVLGKNQPAAEDAPAIPGGDQTPVEGGRAH